MGIAYTCDAILSQSKDSGAIIVITACEPDDAIKTVTAIRKVLDHMADPTTREELDRARNYLKGMSIMAAENSTNVAQMAASNLMVTEKIRDQEEEFAKLDLVTTEQVAELARQSIDDQTIRVAVAGPHEAAEPFEAAIRSDRTTKHPITTPPPPQPSSSD